MKPIYLICALVFAICAPLLCLGKRVPISYIRESPPIIVAGVQAIVAAYGHPTPTATATATVASAPTLVSATVESDGHTLTCVFSAAVTSTSWNAACSLFKYNPDASGYGFFAAIPCYISGDNTATVAFDVGGLDAICPGQSIQLKYTRGGADPDVKSTSGGNFLANFTDFTITNNATGCG